MNDYRVAYVQARNQARKAGDNVLASCLSDAIKRGTYLSAFEEACKIGHDSIASCLSDVIHDDHYCYNHAKKYNLFSLVERLEKRIKLSLNPFPQLDAPERETDSHESVNAPRPEGSESIPLVERTPLVVVTEKADPKVLLISYYATGITADIVQDAKYRTMKIIE